MHSYRVCNIQLFIYLDIVIKAQKVLKMTWLVNFFTNTRVSIKLEVNSANKRIAEVVEPRDISKCRKNSNCYDELIFDYLHTFFKKLDTFT